MDTYSLIPSNDVAEYCKKIGYILNPIEIACLIYHQEEKLSVLEKNALYRELIQCYPNTEFHESVKFRGGSSLHEYLHALIKWNEGAIDFLHEIPKKTSNPYVYELTSGIRDSLELPPAQYDTFEEAFHAVQPYWDKIHAFWRGNQTVRFWKRRKKRTKNDLSLFADVNEEGALLWFSADERLVLNGMQCPGKLSRLNLFLPVPFEIGDIVDDSDGNPLLLKTLPQRELSCTDLQYYADVAKTPPWATVYYLTRDGELAESYHVEFSLHHPLSQGWGAYTFNLQYYRGELNGAYKSFPPLSAYIKKVGIEQFMKEASYTVRQNIRRISDYEDTSEFFRTVVQDLENRTVVHDLENRRDEAKAIVDAYMKSGKSFDDIMAFLK